MGEPVTDDLNSSEKSEDQCKVSSRSAAGRPPARRSTTSSDNSAKRSQSANRIAAKNLGLAKKTGDLTAQELATLANEAPDLYREIVKNDANARHLAWVGLTVQVLGHLSGLAALFMLILVAWHLIDFGYPVEATSIICSGAVSIVAVFVTGRFVKRQSSAIGNDNSRLDS